ncbi:MAG: UDP-2,3-diacylglucosamine diphosphatase [Bacteroidetes bacterium]|nr:UDP-2,3-diacylglucosamine diphosphatase [Bacteroidota bacterium]MCB0842670.1 UDP-2,3-diacylglucosamine diphosphatase [Bacteroidota bacterium]
MKKRKVEIAVISDLHLGTYGCRANELVKYLKSIQPEMLILNGDIIDIWQFSKRYWPKSHMQVIKEIIKLAARDIPVYYLTGNHDELLRRFSDFSLGSFHLKDKLVLELDGKKAWFFHGDIFDASMKHAKWLAKLGAIGYDLLILINALVNWTLEKFGQKKMSFSRKVKESVKTAIKYIGDFEQIAAGLAIDQEYDYVICGHIHQAQHRIITGETGAVTYLNSGDWIESLTALEYQKGEWSVFYFEETEDMIPGAQHTDFEEVESQETEDNEPVLLPA